MNKAAAALATPDSARAKPGNIEKLRLGDVLVQQLLISQEQLGQALELQEIGRAHV